MQLLRRAQKLEPEALGQIHDLYYLRIYRYVAFRVQDQHTAEDLTSEIFLRLLTALHDRQGPQHTLQGWLYGAAANVVKEFYRRQVRFLTVPLAENLAENGRTLDDQYDLLMLRQNLAAVLQDLTDDQQNVLALRFGYELPIREVARLLGKSEGSIKMLQARAMGSLAHRLVVRGVEA